MINTISKPSLSGHAARSKKSEQSFSPLSVVRKLHPYPLSLLAVFADHDIYISGSQSLELYRPGHAVSKESDFDVYLPRKPEAVVDLMHTLRFAPIRWNNFLATYLTQAIQYGTALLPYVQIFDLAQNLETHPDKLKKYFAARFDDPSSRGFFEGFNYAYEECWNAIQELYGPGAEDSHAEDAISMDGSTLNGSASEDSLSNLSDDGTSDYPGHLWERLRAKACKKIMVYTNNGYKHCSLPSSITDLMHLIRKRDSMPSEIEDALREARKSWIKQGWPEQLLQGYMGYRANMQYVTPMASLFEETQGVYGQDVASDGVIHFTRRKDFDMLRGTLPSGVKVQVMLINPKHSSVLHTMLGYYATHPICGIGGAHGFHLYAEAAERGLSYELDIRDIEWKQKSAPAAKIKYEERGWKFEPMCRKMSVRTGGDKGVRRTSYKHIYTSALPRKHRYKLPKWWNAYFKSREIALTRSSWVENEGKITNVFSGHEFIDTSNSLSEWVQDTLRHHDEVIPWGKWKKREHEEWVHLDLWFGGARSLACWLRHRNDARG